MGRSELLLPHLSLYSESIRPFSFSAMEKTWVSLKKNIDFVRVYRSGRSRSNPWMTLYGKPNSSDGFRMGFSVSRKVGNSVVRNRLKRRLREIVRREMDRIPAGYDWVLILRPPAAKLDYWELERNFLQLLDKFDPEKD